MFTYADKMPSLLFSSSKILSSFNGFKWTFSYKALFIPYVKMNKQASYNRKANQCYIAVKSLSYEHVWV